MQVMNIFSGKAMGLTEGHNYHHKGKGPDTMVVHRMTRQEPLTLLGRVTGALGMTM